MSNKGQIKTRIIAGVTEFTLVRDEQRDPKIGATNKRLFAREVRVSERLRVRAERGARASKVGGGIGCT